MFQREPGYTLQRPPKAEDQALLLRVDGVPVGFDLARNCKPTSTDPGVSTAAQACGAIEMLLELADATDETLHTTAFCETANSFARSLPSRIAELVRIVKYRVFTSAVAIATPRTSPDGQEETLRINRKSDRESCGLTCCLLETLAVWAARKVAPRGAAHSSSSSSGGGGGGGSGGSVVAALLLMYLHARTPAQLCASLDLADWPPVWRDLYRRDGAFRSRCDAVRAQRPCVRDPANPLNNLGAGPHGVTAVGWALLQLALSAATQATTHGGIAGQPVLADKAAVVRLSELGFDGSAPCS
ncbi:hypothetical protein JKP88DRAFT_303978 [Tribonema minus]|uniref:Uncharacterized protein n=1 Tax=Tribonema minus TaxID=303371 RepID=A0A836CMC1_9STRA|nr:hypothetical protein JKP88DRAFT_303978 [Tribonema minus]